MTTALALLLGLLSTPDPRTALKQYVATPDSSFSWSKSAWEGRPDLKLVSQTWHGHVWRHDLVVCRPRQGGSSKTWVLHVTGGEPNAFDVDWSQGLADQSGCPVAVLFQIPAQPLWEKKEDDLIAHTFEQYLDTGDETWPLLFPMVKSAVRSMDALQEFDKEAEDFVVFGASKRGWTSWLTAATEDKRVAGIAPMLFDNLDMPAQLAKQLRDWGEFSPMIKDYTSRHLEDVVESEMGKNLVAMIDPASYFDRIKVPVLVVNAGNDPYWTVDASSLYWDKIRAPKWLVTVPNLGHAFERTEWWTPSVAAFARMCAGGPKLGAIHANREQDGRWKFRTEPRAVVSDLWKCPSTTLRFDNCQWVGQAPGTGGASGAAAQEETVELGQPGSRNYAWFKAYQFQSGKLKYWLTTPVQVAKAAP